jgi:hypothetical protein
MAPLPPDLNVKHRRSAAKVEYSGRNCSSRWCRCTSCRWGSIRHPWCTRTESLPLRKAWKGGSSPCHCCEFASRQTLCAIRSEPEVAVSSWVSEAKACRRCNCNIRCCCICTWSRAGSILHPCRRHRGYLPPDSRSTDRSSLCHRYESATRQTRSATRCVFVVAVSWRISQAFWRERLVRRRLRSPWESALSPAVIAESIAQTDHVRSRPPRLTKDARVPRPPAVFQTFREKLHSPHLAGSDVWYDKMDVAAI